MPEPSPPTRSDEDLITLVLQHGDRDAYGALVRRHQSGVRSLLRSLTRGNAMWADDLAQDTFLKVFLKLGSFRGEARFSTWLYRIAYNNFLASLRGSAARNHSAEVELRAPAESDSTLAVDLERAMRSLSDSERAAITLCYSLDLTHPEAARILECPVGTLKTHILRGKEKLRARLGAWKGKVSNG